VRPFSILGLSPTGHESSGACALDLIDAEYVRDVEPSEIVIIDENGVKSLKPFSEGRKSHCIFEFILKIY
jgi:amidophosphoribosyltransferase